MVRPWTTLEISASMGLARARRFLRLVGKPIDRGATADGRALVRADDCWCFHEPFVRSGSQQISFASLLDVVKTIVDGG